MMAQHGRAQSPDIIAFFFSFFFIQMWFWPDFHRVITFPLLFTFISSGEGGLWGSASLNFD